MKKTPKKQCPHCLSLSDHERECPKRKGEGVRSRPMAPMISCVVCNCTISSGDRCADCALQEEQRRLEMLHAGPLLLKALIEVGFERDMGDEMSCRGCGMPLAHVYERKHGTLYEGSEIRQCPVDEALKAVPR